MRKEQIDQMWNSEGSCIVCGEKCETWRDHDRGIKKTDCSECGRHWLSHSLVRFRFVDQILRSRIAERLKLIKDNGQPVLVVCSEPSSDLVGYKQILIVDPSGELVVRSADLA